MRQTQKEKLLPEQTAEKIRGYIEGNGLKVGDKLPNEFQLAEICGVGRSTVREAIKLLVFSGKVEVIRGSGTYIKKEKASQASPAVNDDPIGLQEISEEILFQTGLEFVDVRLMLEPEVAAMAATNADYADCQKLQQIQKKVEDLCGVLAGYMGSIKMYVVNLLPIQEEIVKNCPEDETTILVRRFMMRIAEQMAIKKHDMMLITGEDLGQVASQTAEALVVTDAVVKMPVMRPLIAMDKVDIMDKAQEIGTYDISIQPYEDCCTVFLPKHPVTKPKLKNIEKSEEALDVDALVKAAVDSAETVLIEPKR